MGARLQHGAMRSPAYVLTIAAATLAGAITGVALGLAAVPLLKRVMLRPRREPISWSGADD